MEDVNVALLPKPKEKKNKVKRCLLKCFKLFLLSLFLLSLAVVLFLWYFCSVEVCLIGTTAFRWPNSTSFEPFSVITERLRKERQNAFIPKSMSNTSEKLSDFSIKKLDVIVMLQIQNTGATVFLKHLIEDLALDKPCTCRRKRRLCHCYRPNRKGSSWLFSRYTSGWKCGVHPDWNELTNCVDSALDEEEGKLLKRRYFYITVLRDPVKRFLSEYWNFKRGISTWKSSRHRCGGREITRKELPLCFDEDDISNASLDEYLSCSYNSAINRQARMLSDLALVNCYNFSSMPKEERDLIILSSAKTNLHKMSFFGIAEFPKKSSYMFELTFGMNFLDKDQVLHANGGHNVERKEFLNSISERVIERIKEVNRLDVELYQYARQVLNYRFEKVKDVDPEFTDNFSLLDKDKIATVDWAEREDTIDNA